MFYIVMGVSGSGKSTVGKLLSDRLDCPFYDADDFHPFSNIEKMRQGIALEDSDRLPWLLQLGELVARSINEKKSGVLACSALKEKYREIIEGKNSQNITWIYLYGDYKTIHQRLKDRTNHFLNEELLCSQFDTLEEPKDALTIDVNLEPQKIVQQIIELEKV